MGSIQGGGSGQPRFHARGNTASSDHHGRPDTLVQEWRIADWSQWPDRVTSILVRSECSWAMAGLGGAGRSWFHWFFGVMACWAVLLLPFFLVSVWIERWIAARMLPKEDRPLAVRWSWIANISSYALILVFFFVPMILSWWCLESFPWVREFSSLLHDGAGLL